MVFAVLMSSVLFLLKDVPESFEKKSKAGSTAPLGLTGPLLLVFVGIVVFFIGMNGFWSFVERIADQAGLSGDFVASALAASVLVSGLGSLLAAWMSDRFGRIGPICVGIAMVAGSMGLVLFGLSNLLFLVVINGFSLMYNFIIPFQSGWVAELDSTGRNITLLGVVQSGGISLGPIVAATVITGTNYLPVVYMSMFFLFLSTLIFGVLWMWVSGRTAGIDAAAA